MLYVLMCCDKPLLSRHFHVQLYAMHSSRRPKHHGSQQLQQTMTHSPHLLILQQLLFYLLNLKPLFLLQYIFNFEIVNSVSVSVSVRKFEFRQRHKQPITFNNFPHLRRKLSDLKKDTPTVFDDKKLPRNFL